MAVQPSIWDHLAGPDIAYCTICGAIVHERYWETHERWHQQLDKERSQRTLVEDSVR